MLIPSGNGFHCYLVGLSIHLVSSRRPHVKQNLSSPFLFPNSSMVEYRTVNASVTSSNLVLGAIFCSVVV